jgi:hypothetical protein
MRLSVTVHSCGAFARSLLRGLPERKPEPAVTHDASGEDFDLETLALSHHYVDTDDPAVSMCMLSLTHDERLMPHPKKGPFGYDFEPFM